MITNQDKPTVANPEHQLSIGGGFFLKIGGLFKLIINPPSSSSFVNSDKVSVGETWGTIASTWASESRTWLATSKLISNSNKVVFLSAPITTDYHSPTVAYSTSDDWNYPMRVTASDDSRAWYEVIAPSPSRVTDDLMVSDFGFTIPDDATILGVTVKVERYGNNVYDSRVLLVKGGTAFGENKSQGNKWQNVGFESETTFGGGDQLWGLTLSVDDVNSPLFGFAIAPHVGQGLTAYIDHISMAVTYALPVSSITNQSKP